MNKIIIVFVVSVVLSFLLGVAALNVALPKSAMCFPVKQSLLDEKLSDDSASYDDISTRKDLTELGYILSSGRSMEPSMPDGAICRCIDTDHYVEGDIVVFRFLDDDGSPILINHRIVAVNSTHFIPMGDNNDNPDGIVPVEDIYCEIPQSTQLEKLLDGLKFREA